MYMICKHFFIILLYEPELIFCTLLNGLKYFYLTQIISFMINHFWHTLKWIQLLLSNINNSNQPYSFICAVRYIPSITI